eukprot:CAMPEP_0174927646 /NCGR_PEP_ID=MMETSP1355-20121228/19576_1 /TAXON_ID=464990 /ORGANISM="Hemiselmis tepida, Strain CCMP443" /LENGTH=52 /DNA_ID=CAMNT_0016173763 /DNA_START=22 /DNA_END=180 /DNA_ORIENTATION=-
MFTELTVTRNPLSHLKLHLGSFSYKDAEAVNDVSSGGGTVGTNVASMWNVHM